MAASAAKCRLPLYQSQRTPTHPRPFVQQLLPPLLSHSAATAAALCIYPLLQASKKMLNAARMKENRANGIGDKDGRMTRVKAENPSFKCTICSKELQVFFTPRRALALL